MEYKTIYHLGGWNRNLGDYVIMTSIQESLQELYDSPLRFINIDYQKTKITKDIIKEMNINGDMVLVGGGGAVMNRREDDSVSGWQFNIEKEDIKNIYIPLVIYGIGYNVFAYDYEGLHKKVETHLIETQEHSSLFSVRNYGTKEKLKKMGLNEIKIDVIPDAGSFININYFSESIYIPELKESKFKVGINWVNDRHHYTYREPYQENYLRHVKIMEEVFHNLINNYNAQIVQIEHIEKLDQKIYNHYRHIFGDNYISIENNIPEMFPCNKINSKFLAEIYRKMDLVIGMRLHSNVISWGVNTPFISMASNNKNKYFMDYIQEYKYFLDMSYSFETDDVMDKIKMINDVGEHINFKSRNRKKLATKKKIFKEYNDRVLNLIK